MSEHQQMPAISKRNLLWVGAGIGALFALFLGMYAATNDGVRPGTTVSGVAIGGMSTDRAVGVLEEGLGTALNQKIEISAGDQFFKSVPGLPESPLMPQQLLSRPLRVALIPLAWSRI